MSNNKTSQSPSLKLREMLSGFWVTQMIYAVAKLGVADFLKEGPKHYAELATATGTKPDLLYRVLRGLASLGIFAEEPKDHFALTPLANLLQSDTPGSLKYLAIFYGEQPYQTFGHLLHSLKTGEVAYEHLFGIHHFDYLKKDKEAAEIFNKAMTNISVEQAKAITATYDFSNIGTLVDIAGGQGLLLASVLKKYPKMKGILFDLPHVIEGAKDFLKSQNLLDRCQLIAGSFFEEVPKGGDAYMLKYIIHDWNDIENLKILKNCHQAMSWEAKLLVIEQVILPGNEPQFAKLADINMLIQLGGKERTSEEFQNLLDRAGFHLQKIIPTPYLLSVIEGKKKDG